MEPFKVVLKKPQNYNLYFIFLLMTFILDLFLFRQRIFPNFSYVLSTKMSNIFEYYEIVVSAITESAVKKGGLTGARLLRKLINPLSLKYRKLIRIKEEPKAEMWERLTRAFLGERPELIIC